MPDFNPGGAADLNQAVKLRYEANPDTNAFSDAEKAKLAGIAAGATANSADVALLARANHSGTQAIATVAGLQAALDARAALAVTQNFTAAQGTAIVTLADAATVALDASLSNAFRVTLGGARTMAAPTNLVEGRVYTLAIRQDGTGSRTLAWNAVFKWLSGSAPTLKTAANAIDIVTFYHDGSNCCAVHSGGY